MTWLVCLALVGLLQAGCYRTAIQDEGLQPSGLTEHLWHNYFFWGLAGHPTVDVRQHCGGADVHEVILARNFGTWTLSLLTVGLYSPRKTLLRCAVHPAQADAHSGEVTP